MFYNVKIRQCPRTNVWGGGGGGGGGELICTAETSTRFIMAITPATSRPSHDRGDFLNISAKYLSHFSFPGLLCFGLVSMSFFFFFFFFSSSSSFLRFLLHFIALI